MPPWTYAKDYSSQAKSSYSAGREALRREAQLEAGITEPPPTKSLDAAFDELKRELEASPGATLVKAENRYLYAEVADPVTGAIDDVECARARAPQLSRTHVCRPAHARAPASHPAGSSSASTFRSSVIARRHAPAATTSGSATASATSARRSSRWGGRASDASSSDGGVSKVR